MPTLTKKKIRKKLLGLKETKHHITINNKLMHEKATSESKHSVHSITAPEKGSLKEK